MQSDHLSFRDRADAGRQLAQRLMANVVQNPVVLALPRGGVPVAFKVAKALRAPLDLIVVLKMGRLAKPSSAWVRSWTEPIRRSY
ncbi:hypothetical protein [Microvirga terrae]|uniref:hypothetical protein n=1 Tax=Microvirga terrae TaxID=2740529 RepID=UPI0032E7FAF7